MVNKLYRRLCEPSGVPAFSLEFDESYRPVKLEKHVIGYDRGYGKNGFQFDNMLNYKIRQIIDTYSSGMPTLVVDRIKQSFARREKVL